MANELKLNDISEHLLILNKTTIDKLFRTENPADVVSLYIFYYYTAKWQQTNQPKCTTYYTANALQWSETKTRKIKNQLLELGLIEDVKSRDTNGKISGHFIKVNYILKQSTLSNIHTLENPQGGEIYGVAENETNALKEYIKCLKKDIEMLKNNNNISYKENVITDVINLYNEICVSLPKVKTVSNARKTAIKSLVNKYDIEQIQTVFTKAETSNFLKGNNNRSWQANFDWLIKDNNFVKVLDGNYDCAAHIEAPNFASYDIDLFEQMLNEKE